mgnify:CR=1 FL=1
MFLIVKINEEFSMGGVGKSRKYVRRGAAEWGVLIVEADRSKMSARAFCTKHDISAAGLYKWRSRLKKKAAFVPVQVRSELGDTRINPGSQPAFLPPFPHPPLQITSPLIIHSSSGLKIEFPSGCLGSELRLVAEVFNV